MVQESAEGGPSHMRGGRYYAQCRHCGGWREVTPVGGANWEFFEIREAVFACCGEEQTVTFTVEKDYLDFH